MNRDKETITAMIWITIAVLFGLGVIAAPFVWGRFRETPLTPDIRDARAQGKTVRLGNGAVHYVDRGPADGSVVVMVHGFSTPLFVFEQNAAALTKAGFRVILFDHFGRGWSDRPHGRYDAGFFDRELLDLLDALELSEPVALVGYSMGGIIAATFTARHPERVGHLFLITPAGLELNMPTSGLLAGLINVPLIGDWLWRLRGRSTVLSDPQFDEAALPPDRRLLGDVSEQMAYPGYLPALLATWRNLPMRDRDRIFGEAAATGVPMMAVFGGRDLTIGSASADRLRAVAPQALIEIIADGNHGLNYQMYDVLNPLLIDFLRQRPEAAQGTADHSVG